MILSFVKSLLILNILLAQNKSFIAQGSPTFSPDGGFASQGVLPAGQIGMIQSIEQQTKPSDGFSTRRRGSGSQVQEQMYDKGRSTQDPDFVQVPSKQAFIREMGRTDNLENRVAALEAKTSNPSGGTGLTTQGQGAFPGSIPR